MKKLIFMSAIAVIAISGIIAACAKVVEDKNNTKSNEPFKTISDGGNSRYYSVGEMEHNISGMKYVVFTSSKGVICVVNVTKDSLEVAKLKSDSLNLKN